MSIGVSIVAILLSFGSPAAAIYLVGDSHTIPIVGGGGPGYPEVIPDAEWFGCGAGTAGALDTDRCGSSPPSRVATY